MARPYFYLPKLRAEVERLAALAAEIEERFNARCPGNPSEEIRREAAQAVVDRWSSDYLRVERDGCELVVRIRQNARLIAPAYEPASWHRSC